MTSLVKGQSFSSGPVWDQMRFGGEQTPGTIPIAGSYLDQLGTFFSSIPKDLTGEDRALYGLLGAQSIGASETAKQNKEMMREWMTYQESAAQKANEMGIRNVAIGSFVDAIKGIPAAFSQGQRYTPEQVAFAGRAMELQPRGGTRPNYYGFVR
jgi:hypothetical protein